ncbi:MAG: tetratricopeptide repeat protein, partial [Myxococcota bacterium]
MTMTWRQTTTATRAAALALAIAVVVALPLQQEAWAEDGKPPPTVDLLGPGPGDAMAPNAPEGMACTMDELRAWKLATEARALAEAREAAEQLLKRNPDSFVALYILGYAHHYGEGNLPRAVYYITQSIDTMHDQHGDRLDPSVQLWEARALVSLGRAQTQLGEFEKAIETYRRHDRRFPQELPEKISTVWPLMQLRRFDEALKVAHDVLRDPRTETNDRAVALNGYTAVLFE